MVVSHRAEDGLADRIYEAAVLPELWRPVLRDFAVVAESSEAIVVATDGANFRWVTSSDHFADMTQKHYAYPGARERTRRLLGRKHAGFVSDLDVFEPAELLSDPLYTEFMMPNGYGRGIATAVEVPGGETIIFHAEGPFDLTPFAPDVVQRLDGLRPHLARAALVSARLAFERARTAVETLAALGLAACAVGRRGNVLVANDGFEHQHAYWTTRAAGRIALLDRRADRLLYEGLAQSESQAGVRSVPLAATAQLPAAVLHVIPIRRAAHELFTNSAAILVLMTGSSAPSAQTPLLQALFDLSPVEATVAARVAAGRSLDSIALEDGKSIETVRNQVKSVLAKTGCRRQVDLARLLAQMLPG